MPRLPHLRTDERAAHADVSAESAHILFTASKVDWPVSGDETIRHYGHAGRRSKVPLWSSPGVVPKVPTTGIRIGDTIVTVYGERGVVIHVGTIAGFMDIDGDPVRWSVYDIDTIIPIERSNS